MFTAWDNSYATLPDTFYERRAPTAGSSPSALALNTALADALGISFNDDWPDYIAGGKIPDGADPIAQAYSGHQFGHWNPQLGDGRAVLLGEVASAIGRHDIQLKGSGRTKWSRGGDGLAWLGPVLREYVVSEAMHALSIPTTRALAAAATGDMVYRDQGPLPGAVLCRVAESHIRVGTFQYFSARNDIDALSRLFDHTIERHYPDCKTPAQFLSAAVTRQAKLVAQWMGVGFIHGVMNTDNSHVGGITIDYGPCAFMDGFDPMKRFSSIDRKGRYAYGNQPNMAAWNMAQLATALLPLTDDRDQSIADFTEIVHGFGPAFTHDYRTVFSKKLGIPDDAKSDGLIDGFMDGLAKTGADFTQSFRNLSSGDLPPGLREDSHWSMAWNDVAKTDNLDQVNPAIIPRNHIIEQMITDAVKGDMTLFHDLHNALRTPFLIPEDAKFMRAPDQAEVVTATFCGT